MIYSFDIDGTLCTETFGKYELCRPYVSRINRLKRLRTAGHTLWIFTARRSDPHRSITEAQLKVWEVPYDKLIMDKPKADKFIDDKGENANVFFGDTAGR